MKLHGLRHAEGSLIARTIDAVFVRDFLGHVNLTTTDRYLSAKRPLEELERLDRACGLATFERGDVTSDGSIRSDDAAFGGHSRVGPTGAGGVPISSMHRLRR